MRRINYKKLIVVLGISIVLLFSADLSFSKVMGYYSKKKDNVIHSSQEEKVKIELKYANTSETGQKYAYDSKKIEERIKANNYLNSGEKMVFLTFDDGPSVTNTPKVLDLLDENNVKGTFFVLGSTLENGGENAKSLLKRIFETGHAIGNHTYSHDMNKLYPGRNLNLNAFKEDLVRNENLLKSILGDGFSTKVMRCPGGYMSWKGMDQLDEYLKENNMASIDWNALNKDAEGGRKNANQLASIAIETSQDKDVVILLMHDTYLKEETVKALPEIIKHFQANGYEFKTLG